MKALSVSKISLLVILLVAASACRGPVEFGQLTNSDGKSQSINQSVLPACAVNQPQVQFFGNINSFELRGSNGLQVGFTKLGSPPVSLNVGFKIDKMALDLSLFAIDPLSNEVLAPAAVTSDQTHTSINATVDFKGIQLGMTNYSATPIGKVSMNALNSAVAQILPILNKNSSQEWFARIQSFISNNQAFINAGANAGLAAGDEFQIYNVTHTNPCKPGDKVSYSPTASVATATVTQVAGSYSVVTLKQKDGSPAPQIGSEVRLLAGSKKDYKRSASLGGITSKPLTLSDGTTVDIQSAINSQLINALFNDFVIVK